MFSLPSVRLGRLFGIPLEVNLSWFIIFALLVLGLTFSVLPPPTGTANVWADAAVAIVTAALFFASVVLHEMSHSLVAKAGGIRISKITLFIFGGLAQLEEEPRRPGHEFIMAAAGPSMSLLLAAVMFLVTLGLRQASAPAVLGRAAAYLAQTNLLVGLFNLLPGFPLDGGRVLRAMLWGITGDILVATKWASRSGQLIGYTMLVGGLFAGLRVSAGFLWFAILGWFVATLAGSAYTQQVMMSRVSAIPVRDVMSSPVTTAPCDISLEEMAHRYFLGDRHSRYPVVCGGRLLGLIDLRMVKAVPRERWHDLRVEDVAERDLEAMLVAADAPVDSVVPRLSAETPGALLVVDESKLAGIVTRADVVRVLRANGNRA